MTDEAVVDVGRGIELCYDTFGDEAAPPVVLVAGLGQQKHTWPDEIAASLAERGYRAIRFDNRDVGPVHPCELSAAETVGDPARRQRQTPVPPGRHGPRHRRSAGRARVPRRALRRRLDGRNDRPDRRRASSGPGPHAHLDHVDHRCAAHRPSRVVDVVADGDVDDHRETGARRSRARCARSVTSPRTDFRSTRGGCARRRASPGIAIPRPTASPGSSQASSPRATGRPSCGRSTCRPW